MRRLTTRPGAKEAFLARRVSPALPRGLARVEMAAVLCGAGLVISTAAIHLHLYLIGYRHVPKLGVLFLLQAITGLAGGPLLALSRRTVAVLAAAGFMASSAVGLLLSATVGFVGIHDGLGVPWATPSLGIELAGFVVLSVAALLLLYRPSENGYMYARSGNTVARSEATDAGTI